MGKYKFKTPGGAVHMRGRDPIYPDQLNDTQVEELVARHPELKAQFDGFPDEETKKEEKPKKKEEDK